MSTLLIEMTISCYISISGKEKWTQISSVMKVADVKAIVSLHQITLVIVLKKWKVWFLSIASCTLDFIFISITTTITALLYVGRVYSYDRILIPIIQQHSQHSQHSQQQQYSPQETILSMPLIFECNDKCKCCVDCHNRVVQFGLQLKLEVRLRSFIQITTFSLSLNKPQNKITFNQPINDTEPRVLRRYHRLWKRWRKGGALSHDNTFREAHLSANTRAK
jgi:hypothetical protein